MTGEGVGLVVAAIGLSAIIALVNGFLRWLDESSPKESDKALKASRRD
jgi:tRNA threonylcarbamoyladenosine modification (KEOPS) complex  Pcc1 subunit